MYFLFGLSNPQAYINLCLFTTGLPIDVLDRSIDLLIVTCKQCNLIIGQP